MFLSQTSSKAAEMMPVISGESVKTSSFSQNSWHRQQWDDLAVRPAPPSAELHSADHNCEVVDELVQKLSTNLPSPV